VGAVFGGIAFVLGVMPWLKCPKFIRRLGVVILALVVWGFALIPIGGVISNSNDVDPITLLIQLEISVFLGVLGLELIEAWS
jgi:hypothetical protein